MGAAIRYIMRKVASRNSVMNNHLTTFGRRTPNNISHNLTLLPVVPLPQMQRLPRKSEYDKLLEQFSERLYLGAGPIQESSTDHPEVLVDAHFALEEFNKLKNSQLHLVRVVESYIQVSGGFVHSLLTLEAIDADNMIKIYQAILTEFIITKAPTELILFGLVTDNGNGSLIKLIDNRSVEVGYGGPVDNRWVGRRKIRIQKTKRYPLEEGVLSTLHLPL